MGGVVTGDTRELVLSTKYIALVGGKFFEPWTKHVWKNTELVKQWAI